MLAIDFSFVVCKGRQERKGLVLVLRLSTACRMTVATLCFSSTSFDEALALDTDVSSG